MVESFAPAANVWAVPEFSRCIVVAEGMILCRGNRFIHAADLFLAGEVISRHYLGELGGQSCGVHVFSSQLEINGYDWRNLRSLLTSAEEPLFALAGRALQVAHWDRDHLFCGRCGRATQYHPFDRARTCPNCQLSVYARISPCVIALVIRGDQCLLARHANRRNRTFTALAGFIEPGESAEQALVREVREEVGLEVGNMHYVGSQPWPFPGQLMLGYLAEWAGGESCPNPSEIETAQWFDYRSLPDIPPQQTLSGQLIRTFAAQVAVGERPWTLRSCAGWGSRS
ncbi:NAD(+) diphosphatase [Microbulbifer spongiae]|uniref:NAD(+) diphosphatase n=1 Tax=Microbulbifer spongiae TaxID=2944933 RepID=A0ABY9ECV4_9GAMM|nr:NAD(+) diphosphatase [Microbulbifer sp. MI-G]WKD50858.1 NAD(+) diphosphatase [Microbulbifer sp. MI-G]